MSGTYVPWKESQTLESEWVVYSEGGGVGAVGQMGSAADLWVVRAVLTLRKD